MTAYKVLRRTRDGRLTSIIVRGEALVNYTTDGYVRGCPGTGLFCFSTERAARFWPYDGEIWKISVRGVRHTMRVVGVWEGVRLTCHKLQKAWGVKEYLLKPQPDWIIAREVKLLEKVA